MSKEKPVVISEESDVEPSSKEEIQGTCQTSKVSNRELHEAVKVLEVELNRTKKITEELISPVQRRLIVSWMKYWS